LKSDLPEPPFPESFQIQQKRTFDHDPIGLDDLIAECMNHIKNHCPEEFSTQYRVPPLMICSLARSGKTTAIESLFNHLHEGKEFTPIFVTYNGQSGFERKENESQLDAFLRGLGGQLLGMTSKEQQEMKCAQETILNYLNTVKGPLILLVDELNALPNPDEAVAGDLGTLLRREFLDRKDRYLGFTSHWALGLQARQHPPSPREARIVSVARTTSLTELDEMVPNQRLSPFEVPLYGGLYGLVYAVKKQDFSPSVRFTKDTSHLSKDLFQNLLPNFVDQFFTGKDDNALSYFQRFTYLEKEDRIVWPLCYAKPFLERAGESDLASLISATHSTTSDLKRQHGLVWEYTSFIAVAMTALRARHQPLSEVASLVMGPVPRNCRPNVEVLRLPAHVQNTSQAKTFIQNHFNSFRYEDLKGHPVLIFAIPSFPSFDLFDGLIFFTHKWGKKSAFSFWRGLQMKLRNDYPDKDASKEVPGVLLRGCPPQRKSKPTTRQHWVYLNLGELKEFLPYSMRLLMPSEWPESSEGFY
jgi:hypothetical protein